MVAKKIHGVRIALACVLAVTVVGCAPPAERAMNQGRKALDTGRAADAVVYFQRATSLMPTNAAAWNYLGLAHHSAGQASNAIVAYQRAVLLDRTLLDARFNLGCLWLEEGNADAAKSELTAYTLRRPNDAEAFVKLGSAHLRLQDVAAAEKSFREALNVATNNVEALNGLALVQLQRKKPREAAQSLEQALTVQPSFAPALLNLASIQRQHLNERAAALKTYRAYLALEPRAADWEAVNEIVKSLEPAAPPVSAPAASTRSVQPANPSPVIAAQPQRPTTVVSNRPAPPPTKPQPVTAPAPAPTAPAPEIVKVQAEPAIVATPSSQKDITPTPAAPTKEVQIVGNPPPQPEKRGFLSKVFSKRDAKNSTTLSASPRDVPVTAEKTSGADKPATGRYSYVSPVAAPRGNNAEAQRLHAQGRQSYQAKRFTEAMQSFRQAHDLDPGWYENEYSLAMAAFEARSFKLALAAWENALALKPDSADARYGFALTLKAAGHSQDAADELNKMLSANPDEVRAHLTLGNLYAEDLKDKTRARKHYNRVIELDPRNSQSLQILYWLRDNPP